MTDTQRRIAVDDGSGRTFIYCHIQTVGCARAAVGNKGVTNLPRAGGSPSDADGIRAVSGIDKTTRYRPLIVGDSVICRDGVSFGIAYANRFRARNLGRSYRRADADGQTIIRTGTATVGNFHTNITRNRAAGIPSDGNAVSILSGNDRSTGGNCPVISRRIHIVGCRISHRLARTNIVGTRNGRCGGQSQHRDRKASLRRNAAIIICNHANITARRAESHRNAARTLTAHQRCAGRNRPSVAVRIRVGDDGIAARLAGANGRIAGYDGSSRRVIDCNRKTFGVCCAAGILRGNADIGGAACRPVDGNLFAALTGGDISVAGDCPVIGDSRFKRGNISAVSADANGGLTGGCGRGRVAAAVLSDADGGFVGAGRVGGGVYGSQSIATDFGDGKHAVSAEQVSVFIAPFKAVSGGRRTVDDDRRIVTGQHIRRDNNRINIGESNIQYNDRVTTGFVFENNNLRRSTVFLSFIHDALPKTGSQIFRAGSRRYRDESVNNFLWAGAAVIHEITASSRRTRRTVGQN